MLDYDEISDIKDKNSILLDVRRPDEFEAQKSPFAINIELARLEDSLKKLDKTKPIFCYCVSGGRAARACKLLTENGFNAINIGGNSDLPKELK